VSLIIGLAGFVGGCDNSPTDASDQNDSAAAGDTEYTVLLGDLTEGLGLSDEQVSDIREVMQRYRGQGREPGSLWSAAADLQPIFSSDHIDAIEARQAERRGEMRARRGELKGRAGDRFGDGEAFGGRRGFGPRGGASGDLLDLSDEQLAQLKEIRESYASEMESIREAVRDGSLSREEAGERLGAVREAIHEAMQGILTADQLALLEEHQAEAETRREEGRTRAAERREAERAAMIAALDLTDDQAAAMEALRDERVEGVRLSAEERESRRAEHHEALLSILDDDQEEMWVLHDALAMSFARNRAGERTGDSHPRQGRGGRRGGGGLSPTA
jgi:Spy/CpxP family protein refolding chaperone